MIVNFVHICPLTPGAIQVANEVFALTLPSQQVNDLFCLLYRRFLAEVDSDTVVDLMFVNKIPFLFTISCCITLMTVECMPDMTDANLNQGMLSIVKYHPTKGLICCVRKLETLI